MTQGTRSKPGASDTGTPTTAATQNASSSTTTIEFNLRLGGRGAEITLMEVLSLAGACMGAFMLARQVRPLDTIDTVVACLIGFTAWAAGLHLARKADHRAEQRKAERSQPEKPAAFNPKKMMVEVTAAIAEEHFTGGQAKAMLLVVSSDADYDTRQAIQAIIAALAASPQVLVWAYDVGSRPAQ